ncbi:MAG: deoxynucleoside kinase [Saprospiraceae bacterium]|jgi:deoxyadenosine/deoxycytidine kinase|nr:deoxynucleoside kinase [Saprospiraceae bacterium]MBK7794873.1 deoxynucleoside kinase [Saprospiraceae bacterium]MBK8153323.1 deoxynucleoside kinase [Saprospiraceae bacterium]MBL0261297.1 deoxynucleoside kinase [Saprospiraceae bacterium]MBX7164363.1 deoxynucleoside kinase [Saprospiraceae bacterium]
MKHIGIAGNIGAGKTTLCEALSRHYGWEVHYEDTSNNPYLSDFYFDMHRWSFNLQVYFLNSRFQQLIEIQNGSKTVIQDRTIYEDAHIFAPNLHEMGLMSKRDFDNYFTLFKIMMSTVKPPDLLIYLRASIPTLVDHIQQRGREYEGNMSLDYLKKLNQRYENFIEGFKDCPVVVIQADGLDFKKSAEDLGKVIDMIHAQTAGLFTS